MVFGKRRRRDDDFSDYYDDDREPESGPSRRRRSVGNFLPHLLVLSVLAAIFLVAIWLVAGRPMLEKTIQSLIAPVGIVWLGLFFVFYLSALWRVRGPALISLALWILLSVCGNSFVARRFAGTLEAAYVETEREQNYPQFDAVLVHGGGVNTSPAGLEQLSSSGDRLVKAARLYHQGKIKIIVVSGTHGLPPYKGELTQAEAMARILADLKIPETAIRQIDGSNTLQEAQAFDRWLDGQIARK